MNKRMDEYMNVWIIGCIDEWVDKWINEWIKE